MGGQTKSFAEVFMKIFSVLGLAVVILVFAVMSKGDTIQPRNMMRILDQALPMIIGTTAACFALSQNTLDMSMGSILGMGAAYAAISSQMNIYASPVCAVLVGMGIGLLNGILHGVFRINAMIATMSMSFILRGMLLVVCDSGSLGINYDMYTWNNTTIKLIVGAVYCLIMFLFFQYGSYGKKCRALGAGQDATIQSGLNVTRIKMIAYLITGAGAGLAGFFTILRSGAVVYNTGELFEFDVMIALVLGGMPISGGAEARIRSAVIGSLILAVLTNGMVMLGLGEYAQQITKGLVFLVVLAFTFTLRHHMGKGRKS